MPPTLRNTNNLLLVYLTPVKNITVPVNMARETKATSSASAITPISTTTGISKPSATRRGRPTNALRAHMAQSKTYISTRKGNPRPPTRIEAEIAYTEQAKDKQVGKLQKEKSKREKANIEKRNRVDDADNEVAKFEFGDFNANGYSNSADNTVLHHGESDEEDGIVDFDPLVNERMKNDWFRKRVDVLEAENASLLHTRAVEHNRLKAINFALVEKLNDARAIATRAVADVKAWEGQMMDRDGEVQRLRGLLEEMKAEEEGENRRGLWKLAGNQVVS